VIFLFYFLRTTFLVLEDDAVLFSPFSCFDFLEHEKEEIFERGVVKKSKKFFS